MFYFILAIIVVVSVALSFVSLKKTLSAKEIKEAKEDLKRGKVIFRDPNTYSSES